MSLREPSPAEGNAPRTLTNWYRRLGPRYPMVALAVTLRLEYVVLVLGVAFLALYVPMSMIDIAVLTAASFVAQEIYVALTLRQLRRRLEPLTAWLRGERGEQVAEHAWQATASVPLELLRVTWRTPYPFTVNLAWCAFAVWWLDLPAWSLPVLYVATAVSIVQGNALGFFALERALQPALDDLAGDLPHGADPGPTRLPLRRRILVALPALNVMTAVAALGLLTDGEPGIDALGLAVLVAFGVALTITFPLSLMLADSVVAPIRRLHEATTRVGAGDLSTRVPAVASDETGALTHGFNRMVVGLQERERLRDAFGTFVDPDLAERVAEQGVDFRGEDVDLSVLFMDVRGFTTLSETLPAREIVARLNDLYEVVVPVITAHGGHANKFIGDGLLAVFGAPERHSDHADRAVAAALELIGRVHQRFNGDLRVGVGVNSGTVVVGTIGGGGRLDFTVIGDPVNTAARVESATRSTGDDLLITEATSERLTRDHGGWTLRPALPLKGKTQDVALLAPSSNGSQAELSPTIARTSAGNSPASSR